MPERVSGGGERRPEDINALLHWFNGREDTLRRQIRMSGRPVYKSVTSNHSWGCLRFPLLCVEIPILGSDLHDIWI